MTTRTGLIAAIALVSVAATAVHAQPLTKGERQRLLAHLDFSENWINAEVAGLSKAQLEFRPSEKAWSIADVVEHLAIAEPQYWKQLQDSVKAATVKKAEASDEMVLWYGIDRTNRQTTAEARTPKGGADPKASLDSFLKLRATMKDYARSTSDRMRDIQFLNSGMDCYQWFVMISSHSQRHILQIREIKTDPKFPKA